MGKYFGTDGIRAIPWNFPLSRENIKKLGYAASIVLAKKKKGTVFIGTDSRSTGKEIKALLAKGISLSGVKVFDLGILSTPAVSYAVKKHKALFGIVVSASHNPPEFNGIKFFSSSGEKISDKAELAIEKLLDSNVKMPNKPGVKIFKMDFSEDYAEFILKTFEDPKVFKNLKIVLDCSNGAAYKLAPFIFKKLGIKTMIMGNKPNGKNINIGCGALNTEKMRKSVSKGGFFAGISLDGDADRCILSDENGNMLDGDDIVCLIADFLGKKGKPKVVLTVMSNYGLFKHFSKNNIKTYEVPVGDKNVTEAMKKHKAKVGGETSGHIVLLDYLPTGDGILSSLWVIYSALKLSKKLSAVSLMWKRYPQKLVSLKIEKKVELSKIPGFLDLIEKNRKKIRGRIFARYSGTEPLLRILAEGEKDSEVQKALDEVVDMYKGRVSAF